MNEPRLKLLLSLSKELETATHQPFSSEDIGHSMLFADADNLLLLLGYQEQLVTLRFYNPIAVFHATEFLVTSADAEYFYLDLVEVIESHWSFGPIRDSLFLEAPPSYRRFATFIPEVGRFEIVAKDVELLPMAPISLEAFSERLAAEKCR